MTLCAGDDRATVSTAGRSTPSRCPDRCATRSAGDGLACRRRVPPALDRRAAARSRRTPSSGLSMLPPWAMATPMSMTPNGAFDGGPVRIALLPQQRSRLRSPADTACRSVPGPNRIVGELRHANVSLRGGRFPVVPLESFGLLLPARRRAGGNRRVRRAVRATEPPATVLRRCRDTGWLGRAFYDPLGHALLRAEFTAGHRYAIAERAGGVRRGKRGRR